MGEQIPLTPSMNRPKGRGIKPKEIKITGIPTTYMYIGKVPIPKNKITQLQFRCAASVGTLDLFGNSVSFRPSVCLTSPILELFGNFSF
jgi:hypothetical protein